jgi:hypothetical protein
LGYKGLYAKSVCVKGKSMEEIKDPGARIQEGQERGSQRMQGTRSRLKEFELEGVRG